MSETRTYNSPLRARQAAATRQQILEALTDLVNEVGAHDLNIKDLARAADVSERTIYRHFPDRQALMQGLFGFIDARSDWPSPGEIDQVHGLPAAIAQSFAVNAEFERETRALVLMNGDPSRTAVQSQQHVEDVRALVQRSYPDLDDQQVRALAGVFGLLASSRTWLRLLDGDGIDSETGAQVLGWVANLMIDALDAGKRPDLVADQGSD